MIAPALKGTHSSSAPLALLALAPTSVQKSSAFPPNPLTTPPPVVTAESGLVTPLLTPIAPSDPKTSPIQVPFQVVPNPKGTPSPPGIVSGVASHSVTPLASIQSEGTSRPQTPPTTPLDITSPQEKVIPIPSDLSSPQNPVSFTLKGPLSTSASLSFSTPCVPTATSSQKLAVPNVPPVFLPSLSSHLVPLHQSSSPVQPSGPTGPYVLSNPAVATIPVGHSSRGASYPSQRSVIPPFPSRNEAVPAVASAFPVASPLVLTVDKGPSAITSDSPSGSPNVAASSPLSPTASLILKDSLDTTYNQSLVSQVPASPGSPGLKETPVSSVGATPLVMASPSTIFATPTIHEVANCLSSPVSSASQTTLVIAPVIAEQLPTPQVKTILGTAVSPPVPVHEDSRSLPTSVLVKLPTQKDAQTVPPSPVRAPISPDQAGLSTKKDPTLLPLVLTAPKDSPSSHSMSSLEMSPKATLAKKSPVEPLPIVKSASTTSSLGVLNSPTSVIKTDSYTSAGAASLPLKSFPSAATTDILSKKDPPSPTGVAASATAKTTGPPTTTAIPSLVPKSQPAKKGASTLATLPLLSSASVTCPLAPTLTSSPQNVSTSLATLALAPEIPKSVPFPSLPPDGNPPNAKGIDDISHTAALASAPAPSSADGHPPEKDFGASFTASSKGTLIYLADSPSPLGTSVAPQTKRPSTKKGSATSPTTLTLTPSLYKSAPAIPDSSIGNLPCPISPVEASFLPEANLSFQGPKGSPAKKHSPTPPSSKGVSAFPALKRAPTPPAVTLPSFKRNPSSPPEILPSPKGTPATSFPKGDTAAPTVTPPSKGDPNPPAETPLPTKGTPTTLLLTPLSKRDPSPPVETPPPTKGASTAPLTKGAHAAPPAIPFSKRDPSLPAETPLLTKGTAATPPINSHSSKGDSNSPPDSSPSTKDAPATASPKRTSATPPTRGTSATPHTKGAPATPSVTATKGGPNPPTETLKSTKGDPATPPTRGTSATPHTKGAPATPSVTATKGGPNPPTETLKSTKGDPATPPTKGVPIAQLVTPLSSKGDPNPPLETPSSTKGAPTALPTKGTSATPAITPSNPPAAIPPSPKGVPAIPSPTGVPITPAITPLSSKGIPIPLAETLPSPQKDSAAPSPARGTPAIPAVTPSSPKGATISPVSITCPLGAIAPQVSKGLPTKKSPGALQEVLVAPGPVITVPTQKGPPAKKGSASPPVCPGSSARNGTKGPLSTVTPAPSKSPRVVIPISPVKDKDSVHSPKGSLEAPESKTSTPLATAASEKVLPKAGLASVSLVPTPSVSLPLAPSPVPPLLPKQQLPPSSPGLVLESPCKPPVPADEDELPPLIPPEPISGGVPFQSVLVNMPVPKPAGIPAPTPSAKQPVLKNDKGICLGLLCAWCVAHTPLGGYPPILTLGCAAFSIVSACVWM
ncbi:uncharacterized protein LOC143642553 [Tamandua tetradactyla]|uniref:uncharacterized protein LOC143642553 n=1 Tax=Tamandua tetradactyla TaxID=48850 RepID=UPI0040545524